METTGQNSCVTSDAIDRQTDGWMEKASYGVACPRLKMFHDSQASNIVYCPWLITIAIMAFHIIFLVTCYAPLILLCPSVHPLVGHLPLPKWSSDQEYGSCPPTRDLGRQLCIQPCNKMCSVFLYQFFSYSLLNYEQEQSKWLHRNSAQPEKNSQALEIRYYGVPLYQYNARYPTFMPLRKI